MTECDIYPELYLDRDSQLNTCAKWLRDLAQGRSGDFSIVDKHNEERDRDIEAYKLAASVIETVEALGGIRLIKILRDRGVQLADPQIQRLLGMNQ